MITETFKNLYQGDFEPDERYIALYNRLSEYYNVTQNMNNIEALIHWKTFLQWANDNGYERNEINRVKRNCRIKD